MKRLLIMSLLLPGLAIASESAVDIKLDREKNYIDLDLNLTKQKSYSEFERILEKELSKVVTETFGAGYKLDITFNEVDMAGYVDEFAHAGGMRKVQPNRDTLRLEFDFELKDAGGAVVKSGSKNLKDVGVTVNAADIRFKREPQLYFEIRALKQWINKELK